MDLEFELELELERAEPPNSPGPTPRSTERTRGTSEGMVASGDAGGEGGRGTDVGSARCDGSHGGSVWRAGIRTAGADQIGIKSGTERTRKPE